MRIYTAIKTTTLPAWGNAEILADFCSPWTSEAVPTMTFRALWNDKDFVFRFDVVDTGVHVFVKTNQKMEVIYSDRVEIFFRKDERMSPYFCLELDPYGRVLDYKTQYYRKFEYDWKWPGHDNLRVQAGFTAGGYWVEGAVSLSSLKELGLLNIGRLEAGIFRGKCNNAAPEPEFTWISWVKPDSETPDFHIPSAFGQVILSE